MPVTSLSPEVKLWPWIRYRQSISREPRDVPALRHPQPEREVERRVILLRETRPRAPRSGGSARSSCRRGSRAIDLSTNAAPVSSAGDGAPSQSCSAISSPPSASISANRECAKPAAREGVERRHRLLDQRRLARRRRRRAGSRTRSIGAQQRAREVADDARVVGVPDQPQPRIVEAARRRRATESSGVASSWTSTTRSVNVCPSALCDRLRQPLRSLVRRDADRHAGHPRQYGGRP